MQQLEDLVRFLTESLVDEPEQVEVSGTEEDSRVDLEIKVAQDDIGKVIGRQGRTITGDPHRREGRIRQGGQARQRGGPGLSSVERLTDPVVIGVVGGPHGVHGTVKVKAIGSGRHLREGLEPLIGDRRYRINRARPTPKGLLVDLDGIEDRSAVAALRGQELALDRHELDDLEDEEFYVGDLVGMRAYGTSGEDFGEVVEVIETPAHEILVLEDEYGQRYVPFTLEHVPDLDVAAHSLLVNPPEA